MKIDESQLPTLTEDDFIDMFTKAAADFYEKKEQEITPPVILQCLAEFASADANKIKSIFGFRRRRVRRRKFFSACKRARARL